MKNKIKNSLKQMQKQSILKNLFRFTLTASFIYPLIKTLPVESLDACPESNTATSLDSYITNGCYITPSKLKVTFFEIGFCTSNPLATGSFVSNSCSKSWDTNSTQGYQTDLGKKVFEQFTGNVYVVPNGTYTHAYAIMNNKWQYEGQYKIKNGDTYYTASNGSVTTNIASYATWEDDISNLVGEESPSTCFDYSMNTSNGAVSAVLADSSLVTATNTSTCNSATRVIGSVALNSAVKMTDSVNGYQLEWKITNTGLGITTTNTGDIVPQSFRGGPFTPKFTLIN